MLYHNASFYLLGKSGDTCFVCKAVVQYIQALLEDKSSLSEIEKLMKKVCNFLPDSMKSQVRLMM